MEEQIKRLYDHRCQICDIQLESRDGPYAEVVKIDPDSKQNNANDLLCLCLNHSFLFQEGIIGVNSDYTLWGVEGSLHVKEPHQPKAEALEAHKSRAQATEQPLPLSETHIAELHIDNEQLIAIHAQLQAAIQNRDCKTIMTLASEAESLLHNAPSRAKKSATVLGIMGRVQDMNNIPKVFTVFCEELQRLNLGPSK